jgi:hypothetical protein
MSKVFENKPPAPPMPIPKQLMNDLINATELQSMPEAEYKPLIEERPTAVRQPVPSLMREDVPSIKKDIIPKTPPIENQAPIIKEKISPGPIKQGDFERID